MNNNLQTNGWKNRQQNGALIRNGQQAAPSQNQQLPIVDGATNYSNDPTTARRDNTTVQYQQITPADTFFDPKHSNAMETISRGLGLKIPRQGEGFYYFLLVYKRSERDKSVYLATSSRNS